MRLEAIEALRAEQALLVRKQNRSRKVDPSQTSCALNHEREGGTNFFQDTAVVTARLDRINSILATAQPAPPPQQDGICHFGSLIRLSQRNSPDEIDEVDFLLCGENEPDIYENVKPVTVTTALGKLLLGTEVGDTVQLKTKNGLLKYTVVKISVPTEGELLRKAA